MPPTGDLSSASATLFSNAAICASAAPHARGPRRFPPDGRRLAAAPPPSRGRGPVACRLHPRRRHVPPRRGIVALLARAGVRLEQRLEALEVGGRGLQLGLGRPDVGIRRFRLGRGLADVFGPRSGLQQPELGGGLVALRFRPSDRDLGVGGVEARDEVAGRHAIAFGDFQFQHPPADFGRDPDFRRFDVAGGACRPVRRSVPAARQRQLRRATAAATRMPACSFLITCALRECRAPRAARARSTSRRFDVRDRPRRAAARQPLAQRLAGKEQQQRPDDAGVHEERIDRLEPFAARRPRRRWRRAS